MSLDITDILAAVSAGPAQTPTSRARDQQALTRAWINERTAPALLPYPTALLARCTAAVAGQIARLETMAGAQDPAANLALVILQTELERYRFLVRGFLRARIAKVSGIIFFGRRELERGKTRCSWCWLVRY